MSNDDVKTDLLRAISLLDNERLLAMHFPMGLAWQNVFNPLSDLGKLVIGLAVEYYRLCLLTEKISVEVDINQTLDLLEEWEKSVGIPNKCFSNTGDANVRRRNIRYLLSNFGGVQTKQDFVYVASVFGFSVFIQNGIEAGGFPLNIPITNFGGETDARFTVVVKTDLVSGDKFFPLPFPLPFSSGGTTLLKCIFESLVQANVNVIFINT